MKKEILYYVIIALGVLSIAWSFYPTKNREIAPTKNIAINQPPIQKPVPPTATTTAEQSGKIDEHLTINNELRDVNFCGKTRRVKQVLIDEVDVVQRIAELATKDLISKIIEKDYIPTLICNSFQEDAPNKIIKTGEIKKVSISGPGIPVDEVYFMTIGEMFGVSPSSHKIYYIGAFDGIPLYIGKLD